MATHSSILAWRIPWTEEPGGLQSTGLQKVRHNWVTNTFTLNRNDSWQAGSRSFSRTADLYLMVWHSRILPSISKSLSPHDVPCFAAAEGERIMKTMLAPKYFHQGGKYVAYLCISITCPWLISSEILSCGQVEEKQKHEQVSAPSSTISQVQESTKSQVLFSF